MTKTYDHLFHTVGEIRQTTPIRYAVSGRYEKPHALPFEIYTEKEKKIPVCPQKVSPFLDRMIGKMDISKFTVEESCQYLQIFAPVTTSGTDSLPVLVWIHGGSYELGCGIIPTSYPAQWVKEQDIMIVAVNYRLGLFGFLGGDETRPANLGFLDIIEALKWIQKNICFWGGNPDNVTIFGQSSGGDAAAHLMLVEGSEKWFQRIIVHSAPLGLRHHKQNMTRYMLRATQKFMHHPDSLQMIEQYQKHIPSVWKFGLKATMPFGLQYGHTPLCQETETESLWRKRAAKFDVLIGLNQEETAFYLKTSEKLKKAEHTYLGKKAIAGSVRATTEIIYGKPARLWAENLAKGKGNVFLFRLFNTLPGNKLGAAHCFDMPFFFGDDLAWCNAELTAGIPPHYRSEKGKALRAAWGEFIKKGRIRKESTTSELLELRKVTLTDGGKVRFVKW